MQRASVAACPYDPNSIGMCWVLTVYLLIAASAVMAFATAFPPVVRK